MSSDLLRRSLTLGALEMSAQNRSQILLRFTENQVQTEVLGTLKSQLSRRQFRDTRPFLAERTSCNFLCYQTRKPDMTVKRSPRSDLQQMQNLISTPVNRTNGPHYTAGRDSSRQLQVGIQKGCEVLEYIKENNS